MSNLDFKYGPIAIGIYKAMLWLTILIAFVAFKFLIYYVPLLLFLGLGLRPFLIKTGLYSIHQNLVSNQDEKTNQKLLQADNIRNAKKLSKRQHKREQMRKALQPKEK